MPDEYRQSEEWPQNEVSGVGRVLIPYGTASAVAALDNIYWHAEISAPGRYSTVLKESPRTATCVRRKPEDMFERFTHRALKVMALAKQDAQRFGYDQIDTEHIFLGFLKESSGVGANALRSLDVDLSRVLLEVAKLVKSQAGWVATDRPPYAPRSKKAIEHAIEEARGFQHNYVGTEHLLLGLLCEQNGVASRMLLNLNLELEDVRQGVFDLLTNNDNGDRECARMETIQSRRRGHRL